MPSKSSSKNRAGLESTLALRETVSSVGTVLLYKWNSTLSLIALPEKYTHLSYSTVHHLFPVCRLLERMTARQLKIINQSTQNCLFSKNTSVPQFNLSRGHWTTCNKCSIGEMHAMLTWTLKRSSGMCTIFPSFQCHWEMFGHSWATNVV